MESHAEAVKQYVNGPLPHVETIKTCKLGCTLHSEP
jgi:hypothetical protein